jgi:hypothetical protein
MLIIFLSINKIIRKLLSAVGQQRAIPGNTVPMLIRKKQQKGCLGGKKFFSYFCGYGQ